MATRKQNELSITSIPILTDDPRGKGSSMFSDYELKFTRVAEGAGPIVSDVWHNDTELLELLKPKEPLPAKYLLRVLKLANSGVTKIYPVETDTTKKAVFEQWQSYAIVLAKRELAEIKIYNAVIRTIAIDLLTLVDGNVSLSKTDGPALFNFLKTTVMGGGASLKRIKLTSFYNIKYTGGNVKKLFADLARAQKGVNDLGAPKAVSDAISRANDIYEMLTGLVAYIKEQYASEVSNDRVKPEKTDGETTTQDAAAALAAASSSDVADSIKGKEDSVLLDALLDDDIGTYSKSWLMNLEKQIKVIELNTGKLIKVIKTSGQFVSDEVVTDSAITLLNKQGTYK